MNIYYFNKISTSKCRNKRASRALMLKKKKS